MIEALAKAKSVESKQIGEGGDTSPTWLLFDQLRKQLSDGETVILLKHKSPIIRLYMVWDIVERRPSELPAIYPLLANTEPINVQKGCFVSTSAIGLAVVEALIDSSDPRSNTLLIKAASDKNIPEPARSAAQSRAAKIQYP